MSWSVTAAVVLLTVLVARMWCLLTHLRCATIRGFRTHHWMYGLVLLLVGLLTDYRLMSAIGLGLMVDEADLVLAALLRRYER